MMSQRHLSVTLSVKVDGKPLKHGDEDTALRHLHNLWGVRKEKQESSHSLW